MSDSGSSDVEQSGPKLPSYRTMPTIEMTKHFTTVVDYDTDAVSTFWVFCFYVGTVLEQKVLWWEMLVYFAFWVLGTIIVIVARDVLGFRDFGEEVVKPSLLAAQRVSLVVTLLLGFHTTTTYSRWWRLRTEGVGAMKTSSSSTTLLLSQFTRDAQILESISRYARASLCLIAIQRRFKADAGSHLDWLVEDGILTEDEVDQLRVVNSDLAESIWTWNAEIVTSLYQEGVIKSDMHYQYLMEHVLRGMHGAELVCAQCDTALPLPYVHVLSLMVKVFSMCLSAAHGGNWFVQPESPIFIVEPFLICFLFNALLVINNKLCDPFDGDLADFPIHHYQLGFATAAKSFVDAGRNLPKWLRMRRARPGSNGLTC